VSFQPESLYVDVTNAYRFADPAAETLSYPNLETEIGKVALLIPQAEHYLYNPSVDPMDTTTESLAREIGDYYLLLTSQRILQATEPASRQLWSDRFTNYWSEVAPPPKPALVSRLAAEQLPTLEAQARHDPQAAELVLPVYQRLADMNVAENSLDSATLTELQGHDSLLSVATAMRHELAKRFHDFFTDWPFDREGNFNFKSYANYLQYTVLPNLARSDPAWREWTVACRPNQSLSTNAKNKVFTVGVLRPDEPAARAGAYMMHELMHAWRSINGAMLGPEFTTNLPGNADFEEGMGGLIEAAELGIIPDRLTDRYIDVGLALGQVSVLGQMPRAELRALANARSILRASSSGQPVDKAAIELASLEHVNRIYAGSSGDAAVGVRTRDALYYPGLLHVAHYIRELQNYGWDMPQIFDQLMVGKLDPTNSQHIAQVVRRFATVFEDTMRATLTGQSTQR
jgi:hypothetical protein